jgi:hypothetical protein
LGAEIPRKARGKFPQSLTETPVKKRREKAAKKTLAGGEKFVRLRRKNAIAQTGFPISGEEAIAGVLARRSAL